MRRAAPALLLALAACRPAVLPGPARSPEGALVEVAPGDLPSFRDDLELAGLEEAVGQSLVYVRRVLSADPARSVTFGPGRVPLARVHATLERFLEIVRSRPTPVDLDAAIRREFRVFRSVGDGRGQVLVTGYYLPELRGALERGGPFQVPLHRAPDDLVTARARDFPQLSEDVVGRVEGGRLVPYPTRAEIAGGALQGRRAELLWVDSAVDAFFLEVQGSGTVRLPDGTARVVTFAGKNGHRYAAVGAELVRRGALAREALSLQSVKAWLVAHPSEQEAVLATNPSYVFFRFADAAVGSIGVPVTAGRTIATDFRVYPKGALAFLASERAADATGPTFVPFARFVLDQDTGGAIRTSERVDLFFGSGAYAESAAGRMRHPGTLYYLLLR
ncbi:MAG TPA: MltA domain-containing protein [Anaeromyxobacteraceae bacterium]|nr:MltA domain-containing protein [Anaeromyxobacteraceae bacterium]